MSESRYQPVDPQSYLDLASRLGSETESSARRTAADRAYYAAFLTSRDVLAAKGYITPYHNAEDHQYVASALKRKDILGTHGSDETRLRLARNTITYDTRGLAGDCPSLEWMLKTAKSIIDKVKQLPPAA